MTERMEGSVGQGHRYKLTLDGGHMGGELICPEEGCPVDPLAPGTECALKSWADNVGLLDILGTVEVEFPVVVSQWDSESPILDQAPEGDARG